jgi:hypothetical protein
LTTFCIVSLKGRCEPLDCCNVAPSKGKLERQSFDTIAFAHKLIDTDES